MSNKSLPQTDAADYADTVPTRIADVIVFINDQHRLAQARAADAVKHAVACGEALIVAKKTVARGQFDAWIATNCKFSRATAYLYIKARSSNALDGTALRHLFPSGRANAKTHTIQSPVDVLETRIILNQERPRAEIVGHVAEPAADVAFQGQRTRIPPTENYRWKANATGLEAEIQALALKIFKTQQHERSYWIVLLGDLALGHLSPSERRGICTKAFKSQSPPDGGDKEALAIYEAELAVFGADRGSTP